MRHFLWRPPLAATRYFRAFQPRSSCALLLFGMLVASAGCGDKDAPNGVSASGGALFGGLNAGAGGTAGAASPPRCSGVPVGSELRIDDFEDGDALPIAAPDRQGFWSLQHDATNGSMSPDGTANPSPGGANGSLFALHVSAQGFSDWGASFDVDFNVVSGGLRCPYNASNTRGVGMYIKGSGQLLVGAMTAGTVSIEFFGNCDPNTQSCWDHFMTPLGLLPDWTYVEVLWSSLHQAGWGTPVKFDAGALVSVHFAVEPAQMPLDVWVDDLRFLPLSGG